MLQAKVMNLIEGEVYESSKIGCPCYSHEKISDEITLILIFVKTVTLLLFTNSVLVAPGISIWPRYTINTV